MWLCGWLFGVKLAARLHKKSVGNAKDTVRRHAAEDVFVRIVTDACRLFARQSSKARKPGQSTVQGTRCDASPTQGAPPLTGAGLSHVLDRFLEPLTHLALHSLHVLHVDQPPFTAQTYTIFMRKTARRNDISFKQCIKM